VDGRVDGGKGGRQAGPLGRMTVPVPGPQVRAAPGVLGRWDRNAFPSRLMTLPSSLFSPLWVSAHLISGGYLENSVSQTSCLVVLMLTLLPYRRRGDVDSWTWWS